MIDAMKESWRYWVCVLFHKKEVFEYFDMIHHPFELKRKKYGCRKCDLWRDA